MIQVKKPPWDALSGDSCHLSAEIGHSAGWYIELPFVGSTPSTLGSSSLTGAPASCSFVQQSPPSIYILMTLSCYFFKALLRSVCNELYFM